MDRANVILVQFPRLAAKLSTASTTQSGAIIGYLTQYLFSVSTPVQQSSTEFWQQRVGNSPIPLIALDRISAPASQAFVERLLSVWHPYSGATKPHEQVSADENMAESEL